MEIEMWLETGQILIPNLAKPRLPILERWRLDDEPRPALFFFFNLDSEKNLNPNA